MRVWGFAPLCWLFLHTMFKPKFYWIFEACVPKDQTGFDFKFFQFWGFYLILCANIFSQVFLAWCWLWTRIIHLDVIQTIVALLCCIGMNAISVLLSLFLVERYFMLVFSSSAYVMTFMMVVCHTWVHAHTLVRWLARPNLSFVFWWSYDHLGLGWEYACLQELIIGWAWVA